MPQENLGFDGEVVRPFPESQPHPDPLAVSVCVAADMISVGRTTMFGLVRDGAIPSMKIGSRRIIRVADLKEYLEQLCSTS